MQLQQRIRSPSAASTAPLCRRQCKASSRMDDILAPIDARYSWSFDRYRLVYDDLPPGTDGQTAGRPGGQRPRRSGTLSAAAADQFRLLGVCAVRRSPTHRLWLFFIVVGRRQRRVVRSYRLELSAPWRAVLARSTLSTIARHSISFRNHHVNVQKRTNKMPVHYSAVERKTKQW